MAMKSILNDSTHTRSGARSKITNKDYKPFKLKYIEITSS